MDWSKSDQNLVLGGGYWLVWIGNFSAGLLMHKFGAKIVIGLSTIVCAIASFLTPPSAFVSPMIVAFISGLKGYLTVGAIWFKSNFLFYLISFTYKSGYVYSEAKKRSKKQIV